MADPNPYTSPATTAAPSDPAETHRTAPLWYGYLVAPLVSPVFGSVLIFFGGLLFSDPNDTGTPIGIIALPVLLLTVGVVMSYGLALIIGMPIAFWLRRRRRLTGYTIHGAAIAVCLVCAMALTLIGYSAGGPASFLDAGFAFASMFLFSTLFVLLPTSVFWLIARRGSRPLANRPSL